MELFIGIMQLLEIARDVFFSPFLFHLSNLHIYR